MASLAGAITTLGLAGVPVAAPLYDSDYLSVPRPYTQTFTTLALNGSIGLYHTDFSGKSEETLLAISVSDTLLVQWLESPVDEQFVSVSDSIRVSLTDISALHNRIDATDLLSIALSENVALIQSGVTLKTASDTLSVTLTESVSVHVTVSVTDTCSVTLAESATVTTPTVTLDVTDTCSVSVSDASLLGVFTGVLTLAVTDTLNIHLAETGIKAIPPKPLRIRIVPRTARIRITPI